MQLNRISSPSEARVGLEATNENFAGGVGLRPRVDTSAGAAWRGVDSTRLQRAASQVFEFPPSVARGAPVGIAGRMQARAARVEDWSAQRQAALAPTALQPGAPRWLSGLSHWREHLQGVVARLKERPVALNTTAQAAAGAVAVTASSQGDVDTTALAAVRAAVQQRFSAQAANKQGFDELLHQAFGDKFDAGKAEAIRQQALAGDFSWMPQVQVVDSQVLADLSGTQAAGVAQGAYVQDSDTIYLSRELLHTDPAQAQRILMEEMGHGIDARINTSDAVGDEGEIFSKLMHGDKISAQEMSRLKADNDHGLVNINGRQVAVEYGWFSKLVKAVTGGIKKVVSAVVQGAVNLAKSTLKVATGLITFDLDKVKEGFKEGVQAVATTVKTVAKAVVDTTKELGKIAKEAFQKLMQSKLFATVLMICRFIPIPVVQLVVRIVDVVRAAYMVYQGVKNKSLGAVLGGIASLAGGASNLAGSLGASASTVNAIQSVADAASKLSTAYNAVANKDLGAALGLLGGAVGGTNASPAMGTLAAAGGYAQQALGIAQAVRGGDALAALGGTLGMAGAVAGNDEALKRDLADASEVVTGLQAAREIGRGNLDGAQSLATGMAHAQQASQQVDDILTQRRAAAEQAEQERIAQEQAAQEQVPREQAANEATPATPAALGDRAPATLVNLPGAEAADADNASQPSDAPSPSRAPSLLVISKGQTLEGIARAHYGENWRAGLAQMAIDNSIKLNQWGSPVIREGRTIELPDLGGKSDQEIASLSRTGGRIVANNDKGLQAKADLEARAQEAAAMKAREGTLGAASDYTLAGALGGGLRPSLAGEDGASVDLAMAAAGVRGGAYGAFEPSFKDFGNETLRGFMKDSPGNRLVDAAGREMYNANTSARAAELLTSIDGGKISPQQAAFEAASYRDGQALNVRETSTSPESLAKIARERGDKPTDALAERLRDPVAMRDYVENKLYPKAEAKLTAAGKTPQPDAVYREIVESSGRPDAAWNLKAAERSALAGEIRGAGQLIGRTATVVGVVTDGASLAHEIKLSAKTGDYTNSYREGARIAGGWGGAWVAGKAGAASGALLGGALGSFVPVLGNGVGAAIGGVVGGLAGGVAGYWAGSKVAAITFNAAQRP